MTLSGLVSRDLPMTNKVPESAHVVIAPALYYLVGLLLGFGLDLVSDLIPGLPPSFRFSGIVLILAGMVLTGLALLTLYRSGTAIDPMKRTTRLVTSGVYRVSRNPAYLGLVFVYAGIALIGRSSASLALLPIVIALVWFQVIRREESYLLSVFGEEYTRYSREVRRWL